MIIFILLGLKYGDKTTGAVTIQIAKGVCFTRAYRLKLFICGVIAAGAMIIPGISGSLLLMMLGEYYNVVYLISSFRGIFKREIFFNIITFNYFSSRGWNRTGCFLKSYKLFI